MTKIRYVKGNITNIVGGKTKIFANEIEISSNKNINYHAPKHSYDEPENPPIVEKKVCICKVSKKATNFKTLIELVKQAEEMLIQNGQKDMGIRINTIRGIYYGTEWSLDYSVENSSARNFAFNRYTGCSVDADARKVLKCSENCKANL